MGGGAVEVETNNKKLMCIPQIRESVCVDGSQAVRFII